MLTWALPAPAGEQMERLVKRLKAEDRYEEFRPFMRGGLWDNFLVKYSESGLMHSRMLAVSAKLRQNSLSGPALDHLLQAQCNCAYWHGLFGGLYLSHLRHAVHQHLIAAEEAADTALKGGQGWATCQVADLDLDGHEEVRLANPLLDALVHPA
jgi:alpha-amylase